MNKANLIDEIQNRAGASLHKTEIAAVLDALGVVVAQQLNRGNEVPLPGIGKLQQVHRPGRMGRNPANGEPVEIKPKFTAKLVPCKALKTALNPQDEA